jgi:histone deacetylase 1/2
MDLLHGTGSSANSTSRGGRGNGNSRGGRGGGGRGRGGFGRGRGGRHGGNGGTDRPTCQLCGKEGHTVVKCYKRFDTSFTGVQDPKSASSATTSYGIDTNWYIDSGATDNITGDLEKLTVRDEYSGNDQIHTTSGASMKIQQIGQSIVHTPNRKLLLNNVLYTPAANKNLISVHRFTADNNAILEFHPDFFLVKDQATRKVLLRGRCRGGLYPVKSTPPKQAFGATKIPASQWHSRLGHPSLPIVQQILSKNKFPFISDSNKSSICDACQQGKSHQLPYPKSSSVSNKPLDLVFSDVWGPAPTSVGRNNYYVSFIDDFSKFTWVYFLRHKSEVFQWFHDFQNLVERLFNRKIVAVQTDWGGEYQRLNSFFQRIGISHHVSCPHAHQQNGSAERKHRHIVEFGLSLLAHASMPLKFWDEAFLTAVYLINRLPSRIINKDTPFE